MAMEAGVYTHINSLGSYLISPTRCTLGIINVNTAGATGNSLTVYDSPDNTGNVVLVLDGTQVTAGARNYQVILQKGCYIVNATGTSCDATVTIM